MKTYDDVAYINHSMNHPLTILDPYPANRVSVWGGPWLSLVDRWKACLHQLDVHILFSLCGRCAVARWGCSMLNPKEAGIAERSHL